MGHLLTPGKIRGAKRGEAHHHYLVTLAELSVNTIGRSRYPSWYLLQLAYMLLPENIIVEPGIRLHLEHLGLDLAVVQDLLDLLGAVVTKSDTPDEPFVYQGLHGLVRVQIVHVQMSNTSIRVHRDIIRTIILTKRAKLEDCL